jgi:diguanylate cyclase (GGDEF)-like protein
LNALIATAALWDGASLAKLLAWLLAWALIVACQLPRRPKQRQPSSHRSGAYRLRRAITVGLVSAAPWAALPLLYLGNVTHQAELILIALCAGMAASGAILLAPVYPAALCYLGLVVAGFALKCAALAAAGHGYGLLGLLTLSYGAFLIAIVATTARLSIERTDALHALSVSANDLERRKAEILLQNLRFETALDRMSQGLCLFDRDKRLIVCNRRYIEIYGLDPRRVTPGTSLSEIVDMRIEAGSGPVMNKAAYLEWREAVVKGNGASTMACELNNGRTVEIRICPMPDGAWVATLDDITETRRLNERLEKNNKLLAHLATHDALTGLANRTLFRERLDEAFHSEHSQDNTLALLLLDLDKFKHVNDTLGHPAGDLLLRLVAERLTACVRPEDTVARLGGDEFAIVVRSSDAMKDAGSVAIRIRRAIGAPFDLSGTRVDIGASIGIAILSPRTADVDELIKQADVALYESKSDSGFKLDATEPHYDRITDLSEKAA